MTDRWKGSEMSGTLYANDFGDGATKHLLDGHLTDLYGATSRFSGHLSGVQFMPRETRGAPIKIARDVALFLAYQWFLGIAKSGAKAKPESEAQQDVMELWAGRGFKGVNEETHLRKRLKSGTNSVRGLSLMHYVCKSTAPDGAMVAALNDAFDLRPGECIGMNGPGWYWRYGTEVAFQGSFTVRAQLKNH